LFFFKLEFWLEGIWRILPTSIVIENDGEKEMPIEIKNGQIALIWEII
jgi:hypothetical protein